MLAFAYGTNIARNADNRSRLVPLYSLAHKASTVSMLPDDVRRSIWQVSGPIWVKPTMVQVRKRAIDVVILFLFEVGVGCIRSPTHPIVVEVLAGVWCLRR